MKKRSKCKVCKGTGRVNCIFGSLRCGNCATDPLSVKVRKAINGKSKERK